jgi:hypothetical protein
VEIPFLATVPLFNYLIIHIPNNALPKVNLHMGKTKTKQLLRSLSAYFSSFFSESFQNFVGSNREKNIIGFSSDKEAEQAYIIYKLNIT